MATRIPMTIRRTFWLTAVATASMVALVGCSTKKSEASESANGYPAPRFLGALLAPNKDDLLRAARIAVRQTHGMSPLGKMKRGETVYVVLPFTQNMDVWDAIAKAWAERGVKAVVIHPWQITGQSAEEYARLSKENLLHGDEAWKELGVFDPAYYPFFGPEIQKAMGTPMTSFTRLKLLGPFLDKHPEIEHFYTDPGGGANWIGVAIGKDRLKRFVGNWTYQSPIDLTNKSSEYPADLWNMTEDKIIAPVEHVSEGRFTDPQGTDFRFVITPPQARKWRQYIATVNNHLFSYPQPMETVLTTGRICGTANHTGFYPQMCVYLNEHGRVIRVDGGGKTGDMFRILLNDPKLRNVQFPTTKEKGYWYLATDGLATNPKKTRDMETLIHGASELSNVSERERAGVIHLSFSSGAGNYQIPLAEVQRAIQDGQKYLGPKGADVRDLAFAHKYNIPMGHTAHVHNYFGTMRWRLRDTGQWIAISKKGRLTAFDDPEVRALAARYGDPDTLFSYDWVPAIPGINAPGKYADYARDPWKYVRTEYEEIKAGKYPYNISNYNLLKAPAKRQGN